MASKVDWLDYLHRKQTNIYAPSWADREVGYGEDNDEDAHMTVATFQNRRRKYVIIAVGLVAVFVVGVALIVSANHRRGRLDEEAQSTGTAASEGLDDKAQSMGTAATSAPPRGEGAIRSAITSVSGGSADEPGTPQYHAADWMVHTDRFDLDPSGDGNHLFVQRYAVAVLFFALDGPEASWPVYIGGDGGVEGEGAQWLQPDRHVCELPGIQCDDVDQDGLVTAIELASRNLVGNIPVEISHLSTLRWLDLSDNSGISGTVPFELGKLHSLQNLYLQHTSLVGTIPDSICSRREQGVLQDFRADCGPGSSVTCDCCTECIAAAASSASSAPSPPRGGSGGGSSVIGVGTPASNDMAPAGESLSGTSGSSHDTPMHTQEAASLTSSASSVANSTFPALSSSERVHAIQTKIASISGTETMEEVGTAQYQATRWIIYEDGLQLSADDPYLVERYVMVLLFYALNGKNWSHNPEWLSPDESVCSFSSVNCNANAFVSTIVLDSNNLQGVLPSELAQLSALTWLDLSNNYISGEIPEEVGSLENLEAMLLFDNKLSGSVPENICMRHENTLALLVVDCNVQCACCEDCGRPDYP